MSSVIEWAVGMNEYEHRAMAAYYKTAQPGDPSPDPEHANTHELGGHIYVTLGNRESGLLACYRVRNDLKLKKLKRVPRELKY
tara:strand:- start:25752 stop:26000 length:249 start_codon:yes stop_codon:yes gene_type:complete